MVRFIKKNRSSSEESVVVPSTLNGMRVDLSKEKTERIVSGQETFDSQCLTRPPRQKADLHRHHLVNKKLARSKGKESVTLVDMLTEYNHEASINLTPNGKATTGKGRSGMGF